MDIPSRSSQNGRHSSARHLFFDKSPNNRRRKTPYCQPTTSSSATDTNDSGSDLKNSHKFSIAKDFSIDPKNSSTNGIYSERSHSYGGARSLEPKNSLKFHFLFSLVIVYSLLISTGYCRAVQSCSIVGHKYIIDIAGCDLVAVAVNRCSGFCRSLSFINVIDGGHHIHAKCCKMIEVEKIPVNVTCSEGLRVLEVTSARECACFDCSQ